MKRLCLSVLFLASCFTLLTAATPADVLSTLRTVNNRFMQVYADPTQPTFVNKVRPSSLWTRAVYYEGLMALYGVDADQRYIDYTDRWATFHKWTPRNGVKTTDADDQCCAQIYLERYRQAGGEEKIAAARENLDLQMQTKIGWWTWIDAIQMSMPVYVGMYRATGEQKYLDHAMKMYTWSRDTLAGGLFNQKEGLWWRDADYVPPYKESDGVNCYWSRGNGWVYATYVRVMTLLSPKQKEYKQMKRDYLTMTRALLACQRDDAFWNVSLTSKTTYPGIELTGTALFLYGMAWGVNNGLLPAKQYRPICDRIWDAMASQCVHADGFLGWVQGTGKDPAAGQPLSYNKVPDFEDYGTGCFLLAGSEYYKMIKTN